LWCDLLLLTFKHTIVTDSKAFYIGYLEILICAMFVCTSIVRRATPSIIGVLIPLILITAVNKKVLFEDINFYDNVTTLVNAFVGA